MKYRMLRGGELIMEGDQVRGEYGWVDVSTSVGDPCVLVGLFRRPQSAESAKPTHNTRKVVTRKARNASA
jgi:hypothetical protein